MILTRGGLATMKACNRRTGGYTPAQPHHAVWKHAPPCLKLPGEGWQGGKKPCQLIFFRMSLSDIYKKKGQPIKSTI